MTENEIQTEIRNFIHLTTTDDYEATNQSLETIIQAKVENRYNDELEALKSK